MRPTATRLAVLVSALALVPVTRGQATAPLANAPGFGLPVLRTVTASEPPAWLGARSESGTTVPAVAAAEDVWVHNFAPYLWVPGVEGKMTLKGNTASIDASIHDTINLLNDLDLAFIGHYEARLGESGFFADAVYLDLPASGTVPVGGGAEADARFTATIVELAGFQELERWDENPQDAAACELDIIAGARLWYLTADLDVDALGIHASGHEFWADPFIGLRVITQLDERWAVVLRGDVGGFGVFNGSDGTWQLIGTVTYATSEAGQLALGWRSLAVDYDHGDFAMDMRLSGPFLGYNFRF